MRIASPIARPSASDARRLGNWLVGLGVVFILCAVGFAAHNYAQQQNAAQTSASVAAALTQALAPAGAVSATAAEASISSAASASITADGFVLGDTLYLGILEIPALGKTLPVQASWSYPALKETPCVYAGAFGEGNLVIAAHNYSSHFGQLGSLVAGDLVSLTLSDGTAYWYEVCSVSLIDETDTAALEVPGYDLVLITCNIGDNSQRVMVRLCFAAD